MPPDPPRPRAQPAVVLYGPPASGKDTITAALTALDGRYQHFRPLKVGAGRTAGYRVSTPAQLEQLRAAGAVVFETHRYGAVYAIDRAGIAELLDADAIPVLHLAEPAALPALADAFPTVAWVTVALACPRAGAEERIRARGTGDTAARLAAYDTFEPLPDPDLTVDTASVSPTAAASLIAATATATRRRH